MVGVKGKSGRHCKNCSCEKCNAKRAKVGGGAITTQAEPIALQPTA